MQRDKWTFEFTASQLADAAKAKVTHHAERHAFWVKAQSSVMEEVKEKGLSIDSSAGGVDYGSNVSTRHMPAVVIDATYQRKLQECNEKIQEHQLRLRDYNGWLQVLTANQGRNYNLNDDDYLFFFGK